MNVCRLGILNIDLMSGCVEKALYSLMNKKRNISSIVVIYQLLLSFVIYESDKFLFFFFKFHISSELLNLF